jgi:hypothetical protein
VITVQDLTAPVALCRDITLSLNALGTATVSGVQLDNGSSDNCTVSLNYSPAELNYYCENVGIHPVTLTTRDASGNAGTCVSMVTVRDTITPVAVCKDVSVSTGPSGLANVSGIQADNGSSDNCGYPLTFTPEIISYTCADTGVHVVTITVTDKHGNTATCTSAITVRDLLAPVAECRNAYKSLELSGSVTVYGAELIQSTSYDNCGGPLRLSPDSIVYSCSSTGLHVVTLTVTDQSGNSSACTSSVVISDITRPTALCRDTTLYLDIQGTAYLNSAQLDNGSHDNCPGQVTFSQINLGYSCAQAGTYETYLTVTDVSGNTATCSSMVTIRDTIKPNFTRPVDITLHADDLCNVNLTPYGAGDVNTESDNCAWGIQATYTDGPPTGTGCPGEYTFVRTWSLQDASGNAAPDQQQQITVIDRTPPVVSTTDSPLNPDIEQFYCGQTWWYQASDQACHISRTLAEPVWTDACDSQISTDAFTDNNTVLTDQNGYYEADFPVGTTVVTFRATDCPGNTATCSIRIIVSDNQQPVITGCPGNITTATAPGSCQRGLTLPVPVTTDNCGIAGVSWTADGVTISSGTTFPTYMNFNRGVTTLTYSVSDLSGNTTACVYQITILDQEPPLAVCRNAVVMLNANGWGVLSEPVVNNGSDDACGIASYQLSQSVFDCGDLGARTVLLTVTDVAGNTATCSSQVTVELLEPITASLPSSQPVLCLGNAIPLVTHTTSGATGIGTPVGLPAGVTAEWINHIITISGTPANPGVYTYHIPLTGACEVVSASGVITVNTMPAQTVSIAENSGSTPNDGFLCAGAGATLAVAGGVSLQWSNGGTGMSVAVMPTVTTLYQVTATDASGCTTTASATINVQNQPVLTGLSPTSGSAGTQVVITGSRLSDVTGITFNGVSATGFILISDTEIRANLPVSGQVQTLGAGSPCGPATLEIRQPVITGFQPSSGPPGTLITISGTDFQNLNGVSVNGTAAIVISSSATNIRAYLMPGTQSGAITVTTATGTGISSGTFTVTPTPHPSIQQGSKLSVTGQTGTPQSGSVVAVSADGNTAVIGGPQDNSGTGAVWVFVRNGTTWSQQGTKLVGTGATGAARQGTSVAISADGNTIASGGPGDNTNAGAVWIFKRNGTTWSQQGSKLTGSGATGAALQGTAVSLSANGNTLASGGQADDAYAGAVWVFSQSGGTWTQQGSKLIGAGATGKARQGAALALSADATTLLVGGYNDNSRAGAVWIYTSASGTWSQQGDKLVGSGGLQALQGSSVAISANGNTILTGGPGDNSLAGSLWVFVRSSGIWSQQGTKLAGTSGAGSSRQGSATGLSADGNTAIWGGYGDNTNVGAYWAFKRSGATWTQQGGKITGTGAVGAARQSTGLSVSANGSTAISGGPTDASGKGAAWVFIAGAQAYTQELDTRVTAVTEEMPEFVLYQNAPNPHTGRTSVGFRLPAPCRAVWQITDASGRMVMEMTRDYPAGYNEETFELSGLSGVFEYSLTTPWGVKARKMVVVR